MQNQTDTAHYEQCRKMLQTHKKNHKIRLTVTGLLLLLNLFRNMQLPIAHNLPYLYGFSFGIVSILYCLLILAAALFSVPEKPKLTVLTGIITIAGILIDFVHPICGIIILLVHLTEIPECRQALWIQRQSGYPHFSERFDEQMKHFGKAYQPEHHFHDTETEMPGIPEMPDISDDLRKEE